MVEPTRSDASQVSILVVEDDFLIGLDLRRMLESLGCTVLGPIPGLVASLEAARRLEMDAAMIDVTIDGGDSFPVAEELERRNVPFAFVTGYWSKIQDNPHYVAKPVVHKPFDKVSILAALRACGLTLPATILPGTD